MAPIQDTNTLVTVPWPWNKGKLARRERPLQPKTCLGDLDQAANAAQGMQPCAFSAHPVLADRRGKL